MKPAYQTLQREFFDHARGIRFEHGFQGQKIEEDGTILIGDRAGPERDVSNLCHEMAHFVEIDDARMGIRGWGLHYPTQIVCGQVCCEPDTLQMTARELRVMAYQANLMAYLGESVSEKELVKVLDFMADFIKVPLADGKPAWVNDKFRIKSSKKRDASRFRWLAAELKRLRPAYPLERFRAEWDRKLKILAERISSGMSDPAG